MKLGKALAIGAAEERPLVHEEHEEHEKIVREDETPLREKTARVEPAEPAREEVPAAR
ncbi:hypothetical protein ABT072_04635 [Streptomyces sp. NPDC002589]|uniref:hypothetical protein n=1 Tax=Streptomyces sp. NPDC002589 TaxID=3154420 RepID=UPI00331CDEE2